MDCSVPSFGIHWTMAKQWPNNDQFCCFKKTKRWPFEGFKDDQFQVLQCFIMKILDSKCSMSLNDKLYQSQEIYLIFWNVPEWITPPLLVRTPPQLRSLITNWCNLGTQCLSQRLRMTLSDYTGPMKTVLGPSWPKRSDIRLVFIKSDPPGNTATLHNVQGCQ